MIQRLLKGANFLLLSWASLSLLLIFCIACFRMNGYITHPQHGYLDNFEYINFLIAQDPQAYTYFWIYFILDFFWAATLLLLIDYILRKGRKKTIVQRKKDDFTDHTLYRYVAVFALWFDVLEAIMYLSNISKSVDLVVGIKIGLYIICFLFLLYALLKEYVIPKVKSILRFLVTSILSLFFILIVYALVMAMPQGGTLIVELFYSPPNMVLLFFSLTFLTVMISHFPVYNDIWLYGKPTCVELKMSRLFESIGLGIIYYNTINHGSTDAKSYNDQIVKNLRRSLGILLYIALFNIFLSTGARYFEFSYDAQSLTILLLLIVLVIYYQYGEVYNSWKSTLEHPFASTKDKQKVVNDIIRYVSKFPVYFIFSTLFVIGISLWMYRIEWSRLSFVLVCIALGLQTFLYIYFKIARTYFKYVFFSEKIYDEHQEMYNKEVLNHFQTLRNSPPTTITVYKWLGHLSNNVKYLVSMRFIGIVSFVIITGLNLFPKLATYFNPINIIILYIALYYSIAMIIFKHILYYHRTGIPEKKRFAWELFRYGIPVLLLLVVGLAIYFSSKENDLHQLSMVDDTGPMPYKEFVDPLLKNADGSKKQNVFFVGSYGGGLKANLWNLLLFHELERLSAGKFMENTLVLSGVSGGAVGIGNYASLGHNFSSLDKIDQQITIIGRSNVLSGELTYLLGKDWIREYIPFMDHKGTDRSY
ncbi:MAG: hypothetical protein HKM28_03480, partial [Flavobacteriaceae bacterium]|nr:hypothetical protein [Flavobacteriaceae bacterium]